MNLILTCGLQSQQSGSRGHYSLTIVITICGDLLYFQETKIITHYHYNHILFFQRCNYEPKMAVEETCIVWKSI